MPSSPTSVINVSISAVQTIVKRGENITVMCSVKNIELIDYTWKYPGQMVSKHVEFTACLYDFVVLSLS